MTTERKLKQKAARLALVHTGDDKDELETISEKETIDTEDRNFILKKGREYTPE